MTRNKDSSKYNSEDIYDSVWIEFALPYVLSIEFLVESPKRQFHLNHFMKRKFRK